MKKHILRLLVAANAAAILMSCGFEKTANNVEPPVDEAGMLAAPFDEGLTKEEFNKLQKEDDHILVKIDKGDGLPGDKWLNSYGISMLSRLYPSSDWYRADILEGREITKVVKRLRADNCFSMVDYDYIGQGDGFGFEDAAMNPLAEQSSHFETANVFKAWEYMKEQGVPGGDPTVTVAVIDTGVDYSHEDLRANMWTNPNEIPGNGIDDDGDGYIDDVYGVNVLDGAEGTDAGDPMDDHGHGTHVAGIIAAANNNKGSVGIAYNCKIMAIKAGNGSGYFNNSSIAKAIMYAYEHGADVINMSFGGTAVSHVVQEALVTAYERCTLVAAAGNDGAPNEGLTAKPNYPACFPFVIGVMSESANHVGSAFTNYDLVPDNVVEYEVYAPGEDVYSSIPNNRYAKWSGTSMAAPVVSGTAALLRSLHQDRKIFPVKALMSRLCSSIGHSVYDGNHLGLDVYNSLVKDPIPEISLYNYYTFDNIGSDNDNGVIDAGETINLGVVLKNKGGVAKDVEVRIDTLSEAGIADRYIAPTIGMISMKNIGTYSLQDCGEIKDAETNKVIGVETPLQFKVAENCPNDYMCDINVKITWKNGLDDKDKVIYSCDGVAQIVAQKGVLLPKVIDKDTTLSKDKFYILNSTMVVEEGATLTIEPGVTVQFYASSTDKYASSYEDLMVINNGAIIAKGTEEQKVIFKPSEIFSSYPVAFKGIEGSSFCFEYCDFTNFSSFMNVNYSIYQIFQPYLGCTIANCSFYRIYGGFSYGCLNDRRFCFGAGEVRDCVFYDCTYYYFFSHCAERCTFYNLACPAYIESCKYSIFYNTPISTKPYQWPLYTRVQLVTFSWSSGDSIGPEFSNNIFCKVPGTYTPIFQISSFIKRKTPGEFSSFMADRVMLSNNLFWNMAQEEIDNIIYDYYDDGETTILDYSQGLNNPDYTAVYPIALDAHFEDADGVRQDSVGASTYKCVVTMSRDMDTSIPLKVCFGSVYPYADYTVEGNWKEGSKTIWEGTYTFNSKYEGGINQFLIYNGRADDNHALELVRDYRLSFKIDVTSAQSMNLQASSDINGVKLTWFQDDYPTVAGYNLYKSTAKDGLYTKVNKHLLNYDETEYLDKEVEPGVTYYYNFTVVLTDMSESKPSGKTVVTTYDSMAPNVYHTPISVAYLGFNLMVSATVTDNVGAQSVTLYYRVKGADTFQETLMQASNSKYTAMIPAASITSEGLEYYIDAFDGINHTYSGSSVSPHQVIVQSKVSENEKGDVDGNGTIDLYDALLTIRAANDLENLTAEQFERADLDGNGHLTANEALLILQYANGSITSFKEYL